MNAQEGVGFFPNRSVFARMSRMSCDSCQYLLYLISAVMWFSVVAVFCAVQFTEAAKPLKAASDKVRAKLHKQQVRKDPAHTLQYAQITRVCISLYVLYYNLPTTSCGPTGVVTQWSLQPVYLGLLTGACLVALWAK